MIIWINSKPSFNYLNQFKKEAISILKNQIIKKKMHLKISSNSSNLDVLDEIYYCQRSQAIIRSSDGNSAERARPRTQAQPACGSHSITSGVRSDQENKP